MIKLAPIAFFAIVSFTSSYLLDDLPVLDKLACKDCERVYVPICASDNRTYTNYCMMRCWNEELKEKIKTKKIKEPYPPYAHILFYGTCVENIVDNM